MADDIPAKEVDEDHEPLAVGASYGAACSIAGGMASPSTAGLYDDRAADKARILSLEQRVAELERALHQHRGIEERLRWLERAGEWAEGELANADERMDRHAEAIEDVDGRLEGLEGYLGMPRKGYQGIVLYDGQDRALVRRLRDSTDRWERDQQIEEEYQMTEAERSRRERKEERATQQTPGTDSSAEGSGEARQSSPVGAVPAAPVRDSLTAPVQEIPAAPVRAIPVVTPTAPLPHMPPAPPEATPPPPPMPQVVLIPPTPQSSQTQVTSADRPPTTSSCSVPPINADEDMHSPPVPGPSAPQAMPPIPPWDLQPATTSLLTVPVDEVRPRSPRRARSRTASPAPSRRSPRLLSPAPQAPPAEAAEVPISMQVDE